MKIKLVLMIFICVLQCACRNMNAHFFSRPIAPYDHVILPVINHFAEDEHALEEKLEINPQSFQTNASLAALYVAEAKQTGNFDRFQQAERLAEKSRTLFPVYNDRAFLVLADVAQSRHDFKQAIKLCQELYINPTVKRGAKMEALSILITSLMAVGRLDEAHESADQLVNLDDSVSSHMLRALVLESQGRDREVIDDYQSAFQKETFGNPAEAAKMRAFWGRFYFHRGEYQKANDLWSEGLRILPGDPLTIGLIADSALIQGKYEEAEENFQRAFSVSKQSLYLLGEIAAKRARLKIAEANELQTQVEKMLRNLLSADEKGSRFAHRNELIKILLMRGNLNDLEEAHLLSQEEISIRRNTETLFLAAEVAGRLGELVEAQVLMQEILRTGVRQVDYFVFASELEQRLKHLNRAHFYLEEASSVDSSFGDKRVSLQ